jgi:hypothetical protein
VHTVAGVGGGGQEHNTGYCLFQLELELTTEGLNASPGLGLAAAQLVFDYLAMLKQAGAQAWIWEEMKRLNDMNFKYDRVPSAICSSFSLLSLALSVSLFAGRSAFLLFLLNGRFTTMKRENRASARPAKWCMLDRIKITRMGTQHHLDSLFKRKKPNYSQSAICCAPVCS